MKVGRNDPCPCGSGKKYKKCCMDKERIEEREEKKIVSTPSPPRQKTWADFEHLKINDFIDDDEFDEYEDEDEEEEAEKFVDPRQISLFGEAEFPGVPQQNLKTTDIEIDQEAAEKRWNQFERANYEKRIAIFLQTLQEKKLMDAEMAFEMLSNIYPAAIKANQRDRFDELVEQLKQKLPEVYEQDAAFYLECRITDAVVASRADDVVSLLNETAPKAGTDIDTFNNIVDMLAYHGYQKPLNEAFKTAWLYVKNSKDILPWGIDNFINRAIKFTIFEYVETHQQVKASDPDLLINARYFSEDFNYEWFTKSLGYISGSIKQQWTLDDFDPKVKGKGSKKSKDQIEQNFYHLTLDFLSYLRKQENIPFSKGMLASDQLYAYFFERRKGELVEGPSLLEQALSGGTIKPKKQAQPVHILCPDAQTLDVFGARLHDFINPQHYKLGTMVELIPAWLRFLESHNLIDNQMHQETLKNIQEKIVPRLLKIYAKDAPDPFLPQNLEKSWKFSQEPL